jgi:hypothetical protein
VRFTGYSFGSVRVDGVTYDHDLIIDRGKIRKRKKAASKRFRGAYGHTPLSIAEDILTYTGIVWPVPATGPAPSWDPCPWQDGSQAATVRCWHTVRRVLRLRRNSSPDLSAPPCTRRSWRSTVRLARSCGHFGNSRGEQASGRRNCRLPAGFSGD